VVGRGKASPNGAAFAEALKLQRSSIEDAPRVVSEFFEFFEQTGIGLMRDEEEWIFRPLRPTPQAVIDALEEHIAIASLIEALVRQAQAGSIDLRVLHGLGKQLETHLLKEEEEVRPLVTRRPQLSFAR
jgi:hypothetical protein